MGRLSDRFDLEKQVVFYMSYHYNKVNQWIHFACIWPILISAIVMAAETKPYMETPALLRDVPVIGDYLVLNFAAVAAVVYMVWYILLDVWAGLLGASLVFASYVYGNYLSQNAPALYGVAAWQLALPVHVLAWILQFIGHGVFERRKPALLDSLDQAVITAPMFVLLEVLFSLGYRQALFKRIMRQVKINVEAFHGRKDLKMGSAEDLAALPTDKLFQQVSVVLEKGAQRPLPRVQVHYRNLTITVNLAQACKKKNPFRSGEVAPNVTNVSLPKSKAILNNVSGVFKAGTITLVLGQPGSGKSSLMKILSGRFPVDKDVKVTGDITFNGRSRQEILPRLPQFVAYVDQHDKHLPMMTVQETIDFAYACNGGGTLTDFERQFLMQGSDTENNEAITTAEAVTKAMPQIVLNLLGLNGCKDTVVGDAMVRGISGGQRKRVTTGEMMFGKKNVLIMDEISTGLDSAATYDIVNSFRAIAKSLGKTVVISLLQPSPEVFDLFDEVLLLNEGEVMYHGPRDEVKSYFAGLGLICPPRRDLADFLLDLGSPAQKQYYDPGRTGIPMEPAKFAEAFRQTAFFQTQEAALNAPSDVYFSKDSQAYLDNRSAFRQPYFPSLWTQFWREILMIRRNKGFLVARAGMVVIMGLLNGFTFYDIDPRSAQVAMGTLFGAVLFLSMGQVPALPTFFAGRDVFYKQRGANFMRSSAYVLSFVMSRVPMAVAETIVFEKSWIGGGIAFLIGFAIWNMVAATFALEYKRFETHATGGQTVTSADVFDQIERFSSQHSAKVLPVDTDENPIVNQRGYVTPVTLAFKDLWYSVPDPSNPGKMKDLLKGITGYAAPGTMTALMGSSGAGKTTLMDVIAGRKTGGKIRGDILLNGHAATKQVIQRCTGYCEQTDIHCESATIREALTFSAFLRQPSDVSDKDKMATVNEIMDLLDLKPIADLHIHGRQ
ncbi:hypothetical protein P43SY_002930 [Pythium insidiosum]|uniref:ABC transporter domain-containing protein n=1 Tax=Pythium insidiosum TaxID=114742 RepID=A0AAD5L9C1_PYTIN|nr:hypothetical protein P43SY_002930 [Pythium insidiosum]